MGHQRPHYEEDYHAWLMDQAASLRSVGRRMGNAVDAENVAEELEDMGRAQRHALRSHARLLLMHLLKWIYQPENRSVSWELTIKNARIALADLLHDSPSLKPHLHDTWLQAYDDARDLAATETRLDVANFPKAPPFDLEQALDKTWFPD